MGETHFSTVEKFHAASEHYIQINMLAQKAKVIYVVEH